MGMLNYLNIYSRVMNMAFILLKLKENVEEPYAIYDLEKFGFWPFRKKHLIVGSNSNDESDITIVRTKVKRKKFGEIIKTEEGWKYKFITDKKILEGIFIHGINIPLFDNIIEFKEEL